MQIFDGKYHAAKIDAYISEQLTKNGMPEGEFLIILVGDNPASVHYIASKRKLLQKFGIKVRFEQISKELDDAEILVKIGTAFQSAEVRGGLVQLPLPREILKKALELIPPEKDIDLISSIRVNQFAAGDFNYSPPVVRGFSYFLLTALLGEASDIKDYIETNRAVPLLKGKVTNLSSFVIGQGDLVGKPISSYLKSLGAPFNTSQNYQRGDKIYSNFTVLGAGVPNLISGEDINSGCHVLDFGTSIVDGRVVGDLDKSTTTDHLGTVAFSPGGIGPVVVRFLLLNFLDLV